jgi:hypothetical protein
MVLAGVAALVRLVGMAQQLLVEMVALGWLTQSLAPQHTMLAVVQEMSGREKVELPAPALLVLAVAALVMLLRLTGAAVQARQILVVAEVQTVMVGLA